MMHRSQRVSLVPAVRLWTVLNCASLAAISAFPLLPACAANGAGSAEEAEGGKDGAGMENETGSVAPLSSAAAGTAGSVGSVGSVVADDSAATPLGEMASMEAPAVEDSPAAVELGCDSLSYETFGNEFLATYCTGCHGGATPQGGFVLNSEQAIYSRLAGARNQVDSGGMPRGANLPSAEGRATFVAWLDCEAARTPAAPATPSGGGAGVAPVELDPGAMMDDADEDAPIAVDEDLDEAIEEAQEDEDEAFEEAQEDADDAIEEAQEDADDASEEALDD